MDIAVKFCSAIAGKVVLRAICFRVLRSLIMREMPKDVHHQKMGDVLMLEKLPKEKSKIKLQASSLESSRLHAL